MNYIADEDTARAVVREIESHGVSAISVRADVSNEEQVESMFDEMLTKFGTIDILVNTPGCSATPRFTR